MFVFCGAILCLTIGHIDAKVLSRDGDKMKKRVIVQMEEETDKYCQEQAEMLGISKSGFINVVVAQYRQQSDIMNQFPFMVKQMQQLQEMKKMLGNEDK